VVEAEVEEEEVEEEGGEEEEVAKRVDSQLL